MRGVARCLGVALLLCSSFQPYSPSLAADHIPHTGNDIFEECGHKTTYCIAYMDGVINAMLNYMQQWPFCIPDEVNNGQMADIVYQYMVAYPQIRHKEASTIIMWALANSFPCK